MTRLVIVFLVVLMFVGSAKAGPLEVGLISAILPIVIVVVIGMVGLGIWDRKNRKTKSKRKHRHKRR